MKNLFKSFFMFLLISSSLLITSCEQADTIQEDNNLNTNDVLLKNFGINNITKNETISIEKISGLKMNLLNSKNSGSIGQPDEIINYTDGSTALIYNISSEDEKYVIKLDPMNQLLDEKLVEISNINNTSSNLNMSFKITNSNGEVISYNVVNNLLIEIENKGFRRPNESFKDCFKRAWNELTRDIFGIAAAALAPRECLLACAIACH